MLKAIREGVIRPLGVVGRATLIALSEDELDELRKRFNTGTPHPHIA